MCSTCAIFGMDCTFGQTEGQKCIPKESAILLINLSSHVMLMNTFLLIGMSKGLRFAKPSCKGSLNWCVTQVVGVLSSEIYKLFIAFSIDRH